MNKNTTCQICERAIKVVLSRKESRGGFMVEVIAHHGYQRPGDGWQTESCFGARRQAYEVSSDAMQPYIDMVKNYRQQRQEWLDTLITNPPEKLTESRFSWIAVDKRKVYDRPEGFDPKTNMERGAYSASYEYEHHSLCSETKNQIKNATKEIERMEKRLAGWKIAA